MGIQTILRVNVDAGRGFASSPVAGTGLAADQQAVVRERADAAVAVAEALRAAISRARGQGVSAFSASDALAFQLPSGIEPALRDEIFNDIIGRPWAADQMTLAQWAQAAERLEESATRGRSSLPPDAGGGVQNFNGQWYVNGEAFSMAELFTANRVNTYNALDELLGNSLNTIAANNRLVNRLTDILKAGRAASGGHPYWLVAQYGYYQDGHTWNDAFPRPDAVHWDTIASLAEAIIGSGSKLAASIRSDQNLGADDWKTAMDELSTLIDSKTADNQVAQQRTESVMNLRGNLLDGLTNMLKGQQNMGSSVARNF